jgi:hypothetical protein
MESRSPLMFFVKSICRETWDKRTFLPLILFFLFALFVPAKSFANEKVESKVRFKNFCNFRWKECALKIQVEAQERWNCDFEFSSSLDPNEIRFSSNRCLIRREYKNFGMTCPKGFKVRMWSYLKKSGYYFCTRKR